MRLAVHVTPHAPRDEVAGWRGDELQVKVRAVAEGGKANAAVCAVVAGALGVPKSAVVVARGHTSRHKSLAIDGVDEEAVIRAFGEPEDRLF